MYAVFGITDKTDKKALAYSVLEGVLFSLYDIAKNLGNIDIKSIICGFYYLQFKKI